MAFNFLYCNDIWFNHLEHNASFNDFMFQHFLYTVHSVQVYKCLSVNMYKRNINFLGYYVIYTRGRQKKRIGPHAE
jgi:hypothetical protein